MAKEMFVRIIDIIEELNTIPIEYRFIGSMNSVVLAIQLYTPMQEIRKDTLYLHSSDLFMSDPVHSSEELNLILVASDTLYKALDYLQDIFYTLVCRKNGLPLLEHASSRISPEKNVSPKQYSPETFLLDLLNEKNIYENTTDLLFYSLYGQSKEVFYLMTIHSPTETKIDNLKETISSYTGYPCCEYTPSVICLIPRHFGEDLTYHTFDGFQDFLIQHDLYAGLSNGFSSLMKTRVAYEQSLTALQIGLHIKKDVHFFRFEDYIIASLLQTCKNTCDLLDLVYPTIMQIYYYDQAHNTEYLLTLAAYVLLQKSIQAGAAAIHIHRNTMIHRLEKLKNSFGLDLKDPRMTTKLHISVEIFSYLGIIDTSGFNL